LATKWRGQGQEVSRRRAALFLCSNQQDILKGRDSEKKRGSFYLATEKRDQG